MQDYFIDLIDEFLNDLIKANEADNEVLFNEILVDLANVLYNDVLASKGEN